MHGGFLTIIIIIIITWAKNRIWETKTKKCDEDTKTIFFFYSLWFLMKKKILHSGCYFSPLINKIKNKVKNKNHASSLVLLVWGCMKRRGRRGSFESALNKKMTCFYLFYFNIYNQLVLFSSAIFNKSFFFFFSGPFSL